MAAEAGLRLLYGNDVVDCINKSKILVVGAGGIGTHKVAAEAVKEFNPSAKVEAHHGNIKDKKFGPDYFRKFELVINALDNVPARQHVNRMCVTVGIPLIDSGTEGYEGRVEQFEKGRTSCYDCTPKATRKTYPICTIRSTPDKPVHCIVWAKELHKLLVGPAQQSMLYEAEGGEGGSTETATGDAAAAAAAQDTSEAAYMHAVTRPTTFDEASIEQYARGVFEAMFHAEIEKKLSMRLEAYKVAGRVPVPLSLDAALSSAQAESTAGAVAELPEQRVLSVAESAKLFLHAIKEYFTDPGLRSGLGHLEFDKDTPTDLNLVTAASNLRAHIFGIPLQSRWNVKSIAGNIIPAIATTNAIVAALQVSEAVKLITVKLQGTKAQAYAPRCMHVVPAPDSSGALVTSLPPDSANKNCIVCSTPTLTLAISVKHTSVAKLFKDVLRGHFSMIEPFVDNGQEFAETDVKEEDETDSEFEARSQRHASHTMHAAPGGGLGDGALLTINDFAQDLEFNLVVQDVPTGFDEEKVPQLFKVLQPGQVLKPEWLLPAVSATAAGAGEKSPTAGDSGAHHIGGTKRPRGGDDETPDQAKAARTG